MSLIKCPECGKEISDKAKACINCGFPLNDDKSEENICTINGITYDLSFVLAETNFYDMFSEGIAAAQLEKLTNCTFDKALSLVKSIRENKEIPKALTISKNDMNTPKENKPQIKCPTCSSTDVEKISSTERAGSVFLLGMFSKKINKSFKCKNCGYTW